MACQSRRPSIPAQSSSRVHSRGEASDGAEGGIQGLEARVEKLASSTNLVAPSSVPGPVLLARAPIAQLTGPVSSPEKTLPRSRKEREGTKTDVPLFGLSVIVENVDLT